MSFFHGSFLFLSYLSFSLPNTTSVDIYIYLPEGGGGTVDHTSDVIAENAEVYRSLYGRFVYLCICVFVF